MESANGFLLAMIGEEYKTIRPVVGITMGDAAGIGPEVIVKALADEELFSQQRPIVIGDINILKATSKKLGRRCNFAVYDISKSQKAGTIEVFDLHNLGSDFETGKVSAATGKAAADFIKTAISLWRNREIDAVCTAPINKESLGLGGYDFPGHTEFLAELTGTDRFAMSFFAGKLRVVLLSTHLPLTEAIKKVKMEAVAALIRFTETEMSKMLRKKISIAVAGLNPHASENGIFGSEETNEIIPAIKECKAVGIDVAGPFSPDSIFLRAARGEFDVVIALYHDQATIPVKALSFGAAVNVTLGLPLVRTSVDHGTAFDIAGKGVADSSSMKAAILLAGELAGAGTNSI